MNGSIRLPDYLLPDDEDMILTDCDTTLDYDNLLMIFDSTLWLNLNSMFETQEKFHSFGSSILIDKEVLHDFLNKVFSCRCPKILNYNQLNQQLSLLYIFARLLHDKLDKNHNYYDQVYLPNIIYLCSSHFIESRRFLMKLLSFVLKKRGIEEQDDIRNKIFYLFLKHIIWRNDPLILENLEEYYLYIFDQLIHFYTKKKKKENGGNPYLSSFSFSERYCIYAEAFKLVQLESFCNDTSFSQQILENYDKFKALILTNELQRLYIYAFVNKNISNNKLMAIRTELSISEDLRERVPYICKILSAIHIKSPNQSIKNIDNLYEVIYCTLYNKFKMILMPDLVEAVIRKIAENLVHSLTIGEFIDLSTLTKIQISGKKFISELEEFLEMILCEFSSNSHNTTIG